MERNEIILDTYKRRVKFEIFSKKQNPIFSTTVAIDITKFKSIIDKRKLKFFASISHLISEVINSITAFKHRIIEDKLYEYKFINPGYTVLLPDNDFSFCFTQYKTNFGDFYKSVLEDIANVLLEKNETNGDNNHMFYLTSNHWFSFTSFTHPYDPENGSIPIITLGKYYLENDILKMPIAIQAHHGLVDGYHFGLFYEQLQHKLNNFNPEL